MNFTVLWLFVKVSSVKFGGVASYGAAKASSPRKSYFSPIHETFLPARKFSSVWYSVSDLAMSVICGITFMNIYTTLSMCRKVVSYMCRKLASYKSAGNFPRSQALPARERKITRKGESLVKFIT